MIDVCIPVLARPQNAAKVLTSLRDSTTLPYRVLFVASPGDHAQIDELQRLRVDYIWMEDPPGPGDFARKTNTAFNHLDGDWFFAGADDLEFTPGWDREAMMVAASTGCSVIGTNDGANPQVVRGLHATHMLFKRSYVEDGGATWHDGPGVVYSETYDHQWVDAEAVAVAKQRGEWAFARNSLVLHHHPIFDKTVVMDETYAKALAKGREDGRVFQQRRNQALAVYRQR